MSPVGRHKSCLEATEDNGFIIDEAEIVEQFHSIQSTRAIIKASGTGPTSPSTNRSDRFGANTASAPA